MKEKLKSSSKKLFSNKFRIVTDIFSGYEVQIKRWYFPFWIQCWKHGAINTFSSIEDAKQWVINGRIRDGRIKENLLKVVETFKL